MAGTRTLVVRRGDGATGAMQDAMALRRAAHAVGSALASDGQMLSKPS